MDVGEVHYDTRGASDRVHRRESVDSTDARRLVARIVPTADQPPVPVLDRLIAEGRARPATRAAGGPRCTRATGPTALLCAGRVPSRRTGRLGHRHLARSGRHARRAACRLRPRVRLERRLGHRAGVF